MDRKMVLDRIPRQFCEGPFWGNGKMGAVLYVQDGKLCISVDHVGLWELRETLPDEPKAVFSEILKHKKEYLEGDTAYVEQTDIFEEHIGRTKLPALAMELQLPGSITGFRAGNGSGKGGNVSFPGNGRGQEGGGTDLSGFLRQYPYD